MTQQLNLILGTQYSPSLWDIHKHLAQQNRPGESVVTIRLSAGIVSEAIDVAILSGSLYLIGIRGTDGQWHEFANDAGLPNSSLLRDAKPRLPGSRWIRVGSNLALSSYRALGLPEMMKIAAAKGERLGFFGSPVSLISHFARWDGALNANPERLRLCVLILLLCEALRFRSIERVCADWILARGPDAQSMSLVFTPTMLATIQNWRSKALVRDVDVTLTPPDLPDPLIM